MGCGGGPGISSKTIDMASLTQIRRLLNLLDHLRDPQPYSARELADRLNVSRRTLFRDLRSLAKLGFLVNYDERAGRYTVTTEAASADGTEIPTDELKQLLLLGQKLDSVDQFESDSSGRNAVNLPDLFDLRHDGAAAVGAESVTDRLLEAVGSSVWVRIAADVDGDKQIAVVAPLRFLFSTGRWYLACDDRDLGRVRCLPLDAIHAAELSDEPYRGSLGDAGELAIEAAWQTDVEPGPSHEVVIRFDATVARDVAARRWFRTQELSWRDDGSLEFRTQSAQLDRVAAWVLSHGAAAEVLAPDVLADRVREEIQKLCDTMLCSA